MANKYVAEMERRLRRRKLLNSYGKLYDHGKPFGPDNQGVYEWQRRFHDAGADFQQRCLMAANRVGKTQSAAAELAIHCTGRYPPWWEGVRFDHPVNCWTGSVTNKASKEIVQTALIGTEIADRNSPDFGTGWIPGDDIIDFKTRQAGLGDVIDSIVVRHTPTGGESRIGLLTYEQGRASWQGTSRDIVWFDEEPPMDVYSEGLTRVLDRNGVVFLTFTPLIGATAVVQSFMNAKDDSGKFLINVSWDDAPHLNEEARALIMASYEDYERDTRSKGTPLLGTGAVFPIMDEEIVVDTIEPKPWWRFINGADFGIDHPAAGAFCALDPTGAGTFYVYDCYKARAQTAVYHAAALKKHGLWIPTAWPHDGLQKDKGSGIALKDQYRAHGTYMLKEHAHYKDERGNHVDPGLIEMLEWMRTGRFKVLRSCSQWFEEKRLYHRKDGQVVKKQDDLISATRYAFIMRRHGVTKPANNIVVGSQTPNVPMLGRRRWERQLG